MPQYYVTCSPQLPYVFEYGLFPVPYVGHVRRSHTISAHIFCWCCITPHTLSLVLLICVEGTYFCLSSHLSNVFTLPCKNVFTLFHSSLQSKFTARMFAQHCVCPKPLSHFILLICVGLDICGSLTWPPCDTNLRSPNPVRCIKLIRFTLLPV